mgnify:CR=1 FL=1
MIERFGGIDVPVNNAGITHRSAFSETDTAVLRRVMDVNLFGAIHCTKAALPSLLARRGLIVAVSSIAGVAPLFGRTGYAASKHAMAGFFDSLRIELDGSGVSVTLVDPGFVGTGAQGRNLGADGAPLGSNPINVAAAMGPEECARITLRAALSRKREVVMTARGKIGLWLKLVAPGLVDRLAAAAIARGK